MNTNKTNNNNTNNNNTNTNNNTNKCCIKCNQKLYYSSFCKNKECKLFIDDVDIEEVLWNEWVMSFIDPKFKIEIKQVYPEDL